MNMQIRCAQVICTALLVSGAATPTRRAGRPATVEADNAARIAGAFGQDIGALGAIVQRFAPQATWSVAGPAVLHSTYDNRGAFLQAALGVLGATREQPLTTTIDHIVAQGDHVVVIWRATGGETRHALSPCTWHLQMRHGEISSITVFPDAGHLIHQVH